MELQRGHEAIRAAEAEVLVIGVDPVTAWDREAGARKLTLPILSDADRRASKALGILGLPSTMHPDRPGHTFLIVDRHGFIRWKLDVPDMGLVRTQAILDHLTRLQAQEK